MNKILMGGILIAFMLLSFLGACEDSNAGTITIVDGKGQSVNVSTPVELIA